jgi:hypothetical protein
MGPRDERLSDPGSSASESASGESDWQDVEPDEEPSTVVSLFDAQTFGSPSEMLAHCKEKHAFDFLATARKLQLDFYGAIKLVNFVRQRVQQGQPLPETISAEDLNDDVLLKPVLENDALLFTLDEVLEAQNLSDSQDTSAADLLNRNKALEEELETLRNQYENYRLTVEQTLDKRWAEDAPRAGSSKASEKEDESAYYFESYAYHGTFTRPQRLRLRADGFPQRFTKPC